MKDVEIGSVYDTKYSGKLEIIEDIGVINNIHKVKIRFMETGYEDIVKLRDLTSGLISDPNNYNDPNI